MSDQALVTQFRFLPANALSLSPLNVRKQGGESGIDQLAELILAEGVLQNLAVYEEESRQGQITTHAVIAGGRRWRALQRLIAQGRIPADYPVPCLIVSYERAVQISLSENSAREPMHPADEFEAFRQLVDAGRTVEEVAARFGVTALVVQRRLKLANVAPELIELYRHEELTLEHLMAFAVTDDHERQRQVWDSLKPYEQDPRTLRERLLQNEMSSRDPLARFVGLKTYERAGGVIRRDLFAEEDESAVLDAALVHRLAAERLQKRAARIQKEDGIAWVDVHPTLDYATRATYGRVRTVQREPTPEEKQQLQTLESRLKQLEEARDPNQHSDDADNAWDRITYQIELLQGQLEQPDPEQQAHAGAVISIGRDGDVSIERDLLRPEDRERFARLQQTPDPADRATRTHSASLTRRLTAQRTLALQAELAQQPMKAAAALVHRLLLTTLYSDWRGEGSAVRINPDLTALTAHTAETEGTAAFETLAAHRRRCEEILPRDPADLLVCLLALPGDRILALLAYCTALTVNAVQSEEGAHAVDPLAKALNLDMSRWWTPTVTNYLGSVSRSQILSILTEAVSAPAAAVLTNLKKTALAEEAEKRLAGTGWLPSVLRTRS